MREVSKELEEFIEKLQTWATMWVDEVNQVIVEHIDELFADKAIVYLVNLYYEERNICNNFNSHYLLEAYRFNSTASKHKSIHSEWLSQALYELCYKRYVKGEKDNA